MVIVVISLKSCGPLLAYDKIPLFVFQSPMYYMNCPAILCICDVYKSDCKLYNRCRQSADI